MNGKNFFDGPDARKTILVADDEPGILRLLNDFLTAAGYEVITAEDGVDALLKFQQYQDRISLCVLDAMMPKATGDKVFYAIRKEHEDLPVIFISGYTCEENKTVGNNIGMLSKPLKIGTFLQMVASMLYSGQRTRYNLPIACRQ
jgi:DNA-binding response OmpR family regulator